MEKPIQLSHSDHVCSGIKFPICYLAHNFDVPMNIGSVFRIADAMGVEKIYLTGTSVVPPNSKIKKTSRSTENYVDYEYVADPILLINQLKLDGYKIVSLEIASSSVDIRDIEISFTEKICLVLGAENEGVHQSILEASDIITHIPMLGKNSSMNVATACAVATFELVKGRY